MRTLALLALCLALVLGLAWLFFQPEPGEGGLEAGPAEVEELAPRDTALPGAERIHEPEPGGGELAEPPTQPAAASERESVPVVPEVDQETPTGLVFIGPLVLPDRTQVQVPRVRAELHGELGEPLLFEGIDTGSIAFSGVQRQPYELRVEVPGYAHRPERLDFSDAQPNTRSLSPSVSERVTLWPENWIPVVIVTPEGKPFRTIADELGWEAKSLFVHAFEVHVSTVLAATGDPMPPLDPELATWRPAPGYQNIELPGSVAGSLELHTLPPLWVGLWVHGRVHEGRILRRGAEQLVFSVELAALEAGMASLTCKLVDRDSHAPVVDASATLKADTSAHRRGDLSGLVPDAQGVLRFERVIPGQHELTIQRQGHIVQRRIELASSEELDLGELEIGSGPGLVVRVVDRQGQKVPAWVEIGPYKKGRYVANLYPPNLHRTTDDEGVYEAPIPDQPSILRVRPLMLNGSYRSYPDIGSRNHLIDPDNLPAELVVVAEDRVDLRVEPQTPWVVGQRVTYEDELGLVVDLAGGEAGGELDVDLVPGSYTARRWEGEGLLGELAVQVSKGEKVVACP